MEFMHGLAFTIIPVLYLLVVSVVVVFIFKFVRAHEKMADSMADIARYLKSVDMAKRDDK